jgi:hypothetical protein
LIKIFYSFLLITLYLSCSSDSIQNQTDETSPTVNFKLKKIYSNPTDSYEFFYNGNDISHTIETEGSNNYKREFSYNLNNVSNIKFYINGLYTSNRDISFIYNGSRITSSNTFDGSADLYTNQFIYNSNNQVIEEKQLKNNLYEVSSYFSYFPNGNIQTKSYSGITMVVNYLYDDKINPEYYAYKSQISIISKYSKNNITQDNYYKYTYEYNSNNLPIKKYTYNFNNKLIKTEFFEYY